MGYDCSIIIKKEVHSFHRSVYEYVKLLGEMEAWPCEERYSWNSVVLSDYCVKFEEWFALSEKELGKKIEKLEIRDVMNSKDQFYQGNLVYHDSFEDYHQKEKIYKEKYSDYDLLTSIQNKSMKVVIINVYEISIVILYLIYKQRNECLC